MLGPELLNMTVRPTPIFLEGTASLRIRAWFPDALDNPWLQVEVR